MQLPANPSISFTLSNCHTQTTLKYEKLSNTANEYAVEVFVDGKPNEDFKPKIISFLDRIKDILPWLTQYSFVIETSNSFPHSSGIASSASGFGALALCMMSIQKELNPSISDTDFYKQASILARLGSGSASRSIYGGLVNWGVHKNVAGTNDEYAIPYPDEVHKVFSSYQDTILLVDKGQKQVSSTVGHGLMNGHPFAAQRFEVAHQNMDVLKSILASGDVYAFGNLVEQEALMLHAMMMTSEPYFILFKPNTLSIIEKIWAYRNQNDVPVFITLDAGANVHVLYPESVKEKVLQFIKNELVAYCKNAEYICDVVGEGPKQL